jgi:AcrR family transcriptional regulator
MGTSERREREREALQTRILEAARDILSEQGLDGLSMRAIAERIEYSPGTIYTYFRDKDELIRAVVHTGFQRMGEYTRLEVEAAGVEGPLDTYAAMGRAYARFALENTAYFRVMFELPAVAQMECPMADSAECVAMTGEPSFAHVAETVERAVEAGLIVVPDAMRGAVIGWALMHGLTSLYLGGHLRDVVSSHEAFLKLVSTAQQSLQEGWRPRLEEQEATRPAETAELLAS